MYMIVRIYRYSQAQRVIRRGLTLEQAQAHCRDPEMSSSTCKRADNVRRTRRCGPWFDSYQAVSGTE